MTVLPTETFEAKAPFVVAMARRAFGAVVLLGLLSTGSLAAQQRAITLDEAIRRSERVQPAVIRAAADVRTAGAVNAPATVRLPP